MTGKHRGRPSFRDSAIHAVAIVPLTIPTRENTDNNASINNINQTTHSETSFHRLFASLQEFATNNKSSYQRHLSAIDKKWNEESSQVTLILPHSTLTRPGDWTYNSTPLKSHDWRSGCQRLRLFDGRPSHNRMAYDRLHDGGNYNDPWRDLENRGTSAVIGVLNMKDCKDTADLWRAEENLIAWTKKYSHPSDREDVALGAGDDRNMLIRLFVFDSFDEGIQNRVNLNATRFQSSQLVAFPPLEGSSQMIDVHWNVVVNDLAVTLFLNIERRIHLNDAVGKNVWKRNSGGVEGKGQLDDDESRAASLTMTSSQDSIDNTPRFGGRLKNALGITRKTLANRQESGGETTDVAGSTHVGSSLNTKLVTPLDLDANEKVTFSTRDLETLKRRDAGRREKRGGDLALLAGSPIDAYERYTRAAELTRSSHDPLWYASALEGCAVRI